MYDRGPFWTTDHWRTGARWRGFVSAAARLTALSSMLAATAVALQWQAHADEPAPRPRAVGTARDADTSAAQTDQVVLSERQARMIDIGVVSEHRFPLERSAMGSIDFNEDRATAVFPPYAGRIVTLTSKLGDDVRKGDVLYTIQSPDLIQAASTLIAAAGVLDLDNRALTRARSLYAAQGLAEKDLQQAVSDQQTAQGTFEAARDAVKVFGKTPAQIERMVRTRSVDPRLCVRSPLSGRITARSAAPGLYVQPGSPPAPYSVADIGRVWLNASVVETDMPLVRVGERVRISVMAFPGRVFAGTVATVGASVDPQLHRGLLRAVIEDPRHELLPGMFASFVIETADPISSPAVPTDGVVREGDGTMTVWTTTDRRHFNRRIVRLGLRSDGFDQVLSGVPAGTLIVTHNALFLDNLASGGLS